MRNVIARRISFFAALAALLLMPAEALAWDCVSKVASGNWNSASSWDNCNSTYPRSGDSVTILGGHAITLNASSSAIVDLTIENGGSLLASGVNRRLNIRGTLTNNGTLNIKSSGTENGIYLSGGNLTLAGTANSSWNLDYIHLGWSRKLTLNAGDSFVLNLWGSTPFQGTSSNSMNAAGTKDVTVNFARSGDQAVTTSGVTYPNLTTSGSGTKTESWPAVTIKGNLTIGTGTSFDGSNGGSLAGNLTALGSLTTGSQLWTLNGTSPQTIAGTVSFDGLTVNNASGVTITNDLTIRTVNRLTLTSGKITTGTNKVIVNGNCPGLAAPSSGSWINGNLQISFPGWGTCTLPVGDSSHYAPITVQGITGTMIGSTSPGDHADTVSGLSGINKDKSANRTWTLVPQGAVSGTATIAFGFCNTSGTSNCATSDVDPGADTNSFVVTEYSTSSWTPLTVGARTGTSTLATGVTSFGTFAVGEPAPIGLDHVRLEYSSTGCSGDATMITIKACGDGACATLTPGTFLLSLSSSYFRSLWSNNSQNIAVPVSDGMIALTLTDTASWDHTVTLSGAVTGYNVSVLCSTGSGEGACASRPINFSACAFDTVEVGAAALSSIYTKLSATQFKLDVVSRNTNTTVGKVELVDASTGSGSCAGHTALTSTPSGTLCSTSPPTLPTAFAANQRACFDFKYAGVLRNAKVRVKYGWYPTYDQNAVCSSDNFAIRPVGFSVAPNEAIPTPPANPDPKFRAGTDKFSFTVTAISDATANPLSVATAYDGTPKIDSALITATSYQQPGTIAGNFSGAVSGVSLSANAFTYSEVGTFLLAQGAIHDDAYFASVDSAKSPPDCVAGSFSNAAAANGMYGCRIGLNGHVTDAAFQTSGPYSRFIPDHFAVSGALLSRGDLVAKTTGSIAASSSSLTVASTAGIKAGDGIIVAGAGDRGILLQTTAASVGGSTVVLGAPATTAVTNANVYASRSTFTYMDEPMLLLAAVTAQNGAGDPTVNYSTLPNATGFVKLDATTLNADGQTQWLGLPCGTGKQCFGLGAVDGTTQLSSRLSVDTSPSPSVTAIAAGSWTAGVGTFVVPVRLSRLATPDGPYNGVAIGVAPVDSDGVSLQASALNLDANADGTKERALIGAAQNRFGRIRLLNANGSELLDLPVTMKIEYWAGDSSGWKVNDLDTQTSIADANFALNFPADSSNRLAACETKVSVSAHPTLATPPNYLVVLSKPGLGNDGWARLTLNLGATPSGNQCTAGGSGAATTVNAPWLQYNWSGSVGDPGAQVRFGAYRSGPVIFRREMY